MITATLFRMGGDGGQRPRTRGATKKKYAKDDIGGPAELPPNQLPTKRDALKYMRKLMDSYHGKQYMVRDIVSEASKAILLIWEKAISDRDQAPLVDSYIIEKRMERLYRSFVENKKKKKLNKNSEDLDKLFDICSCTCPRLSCDEYKCTCESCSVVHINCKCLVKIPKRELEFLFDQRTTRRQYIASIDETTTRAWKRIRTREERLEERRNEENENNKARFQDASHEIDEEENIENKEIASEEKDIYIPPTNFREETTYNTVQLFNLARMCDRFGTSDNEGAALANAVLQDFNILTETNTVHVIGPGKLRYERKRQREKTREEEMKCLTNIDNIAFDGKKNCNKDYFEK